MIGIVFSRGKREKDFFLGQTNVRGAAGMEI